MESPLCCKAPLTFSHLFLYLCKRHCIYCVYSFKWKPSEKEREKKKYIMLDRVEDEKRTWYCSAPSSVNVWTTDQGGHGRHPLFHHHHHHTTQKMVVELASQDTRHIYVTHIKSLESKEQKSVEFKPQNISFIFWYFQSKGIFILKMIISRAVKVRHYF